MSIPLLEVGAAGYAGYELSHEDKLVSTKHPAGWAAILALVGIAFLVITLGRGRKGGAAIGQAFGFLFLVAAAEMPIHYLARSYAESHPDSAFAGGLGLAL